MSNRLYKVIDLETLSNGGPIDGVSAVRLGIHSKGRKRGPTVVFFFFFLSFSVTGKWGRKHRVLRL